MLSPAAEVLLSYMTGLAPIGEAFCAPGKQCTQDTGISEYFVRQLRRELTLGGFIRLAPDLLAGGRGYVVLRRLEERG